MNHTIHLTTPQLKAFRNGLTKLLHMIDKSRTIAALMDIQSTDIAALEELLDQLPHPRHARNLPSPSSTLPTLQPPAAPISTAAAQHPAGATS